MHRKNIFPKINSKNYKFSVFFPARIPVPAMPEPESKFFVSVPLTPYITIYSPIYSHFLNIMNRVNSVSSERNVNSVNSVNSVNIVISVNSVEASLMVFLLLMLFLCFFIVCVLTQDDQRGRGAAAKPIS